MCFLPILPQRCIGNCMESLYCAFWKQGLIGIAFPINNTSERKHGPLHYHCQVSYSNHFETIEHTSSLSLFMIIKALHVFVEKWKVWKTCLEQQWVCKYTFSTQFSWNLCTDHIFALNQAFELRWTGSKKCTLNVKAY